MHLLGEIAARRNAGDGERSGTGASCDRGKCEAQKKLRGTHERTHDGVRIFYVKFYLINRNPGYKGFKRWTASTDGSKNEER